MEQCGNHFILLSRFPEQAECTILLHQKDTLSFQCPNVPITFFLYSISTWKEGKKGIFKACCKPWSPKPGSQFSCPRCDLQSIQSIHKKCSFRLSTMLSCAPCLVLLYHKVSQRLLLCPFNKFKGYLDVSSLISTQKRYGLKSYFFRLGQLFNYVLVFGFCCTLIYSFDRTCWLECCF